MPSPRLVKDADVPALELLLGPEADDVLGTIVGSTGGNVRSARLRQIRYVPSKSVTAQFDVGVEFGEAASRSTIIVTSGLRIPGDVVRLEADGVAIAAWAYPHDPLLPGLVSAADPGRVAELLEEMGAGRAEVTLRRRAYRAGRRAVIEAKSSTSSIYLKVVRPERVAAIHAVHEAMVDHVPVPQSLGWSADQGIVALQAMPGRPLRKAIEAGVSALPGAGPLTVLLERLPELGRPAAAGPTRRAASHAHLIASVMPELEDRVNAIADRVAKVPTDLPAVAHGDFHAGQILVDGSEIRGLVDVDTAGMGDRADDYAGLLAQLSTLALTSPQRSLLEKYGSSLISGFDRIVDPAALRLRVAAAVLGFATGPFRVQMGSWPDATTARIALAEQWIESASLGRGNT